MRTLFKLFSVMLGLVLLIGAAVILWTAHGPQSTEEVTTGGIAYTQAELATSGPNLAASIDLEGVSAYPVEASLSAAAAADLQTFDAGEAAAAPPAQSAPRPQFAPPVDPAGNEVSLTTDVVLGEVTAVQVAPVAGAVGTLGDGQGGFTSAAQGAEQRVVEVEWPAEFQVGRGGAVRIKLKMLDSGALQPVAEIADNEILATPILITDRYATHNAFVTSNLSAPDFSVQATSPLRQQLSRGGEAEWRYTLKSNKSLDTVISIGLVISWDPINPATPPGPQNVAIWGQNLAVKVNYVFGLITVPQASAAGTALAIVGFLAEAPLLSTVLEFFLERILGLGKRRRRTSRQQPRRRSQSSSRRR